MPRSAAPLTLSKDQQNQIGQWLAAMGTPQQVALRCRIVLAVAGGESEAAVASALQINRKTVRLWRERFVAEGLKSCGKSLPDVDAKRGIVRTASRRFSMRPCNRSRRARRTGVAA